MILLKFLRLQFPRKCFIYYKIAYIAVAGIRTSPIANNNLMILMHLLFIGVLYD